MDPKALVGLQMPPEYLGLHRNLYNLFFLMEVFREIQEAAWAEAPVRGLRQECSHATQSHLKEAVCHHELLVHEVRKDTPN